MKIFVSRKIPGETINKLTSSGHEVKISEFDRPLKEEEFFERAKDSDGVLSFLTDRINGEVIDAIGPQLKVVSNYAVGFNNINVEEATDRGVVVTNTPSNEVNEAVAEHAWALMLALARRVVEADESTKRGSYRGWEPAMFLGKNLGWVTSYLIVLEPEFETEEQAYNYQWRIRDKITTVAIPFLKTPPAGKIFLVNKETGERYQSTGLIRIRGDVFTFNLAVGEGFHFSNKETRKYHTQIGCQDIILCSRF